MPSMFDKDAFGGKQTTIAEHDLKVDVKRANDQAKWAVSNGFAPPPTWFDVGTRLIDVGKDNLRQLQRETADLPDRDTGLKALADSVVAENRQEFSGALSGLRMKQDGTVGTLAGIAAGKPGLHLEERAFRQLVARASANNDAVPTGAAGYLAGCPVDLRVEHANRWLSGAKGDVVLRTRNGAGPRRAFAAVSPSYAAYDADLITADLRAALPEDAKIDALRDGYRSRINALWVTDTDADRFSVGEFTKAGVCVRSADDGTGALEVFATLWRAICLNLTQVPTEKRHAKRRHVGRRGHVTQNTARMGYALRDAVRAALTSINPFVEAWGNCKDCVVAKDDAGIAKVFERAISRKLVTAPGVKPQELRDRFVSAWAKEAPDYSQTGVINAVTRAAHENAWQSPWVTDDLQEQAGQLVYVTLS